jgi:hypothetical protein
MDKLNRYKYIVFFIKLLLVCFKFILFFFGLDGIALDSLFNLDLFNVYLPINDSTKMYNSDLDFSYYHDPESSGDEQEINSLNRLSYEQIKDRASAAGQEIKTLDKKIINEVKKFNNLYDDNISEIDSADKNTPNFSNPRYIPYKDLKFI